ncbi:hypothetical protein [Kribbella kalugense]|uniref:Uncharacterized protein n=1 Tax=Kribbella kalugense TaxID=2512221 RepID=A0A4R8A294_9ACTN|nr:hypothetical protein [Kribbella kalugense]TDW24335.1 hypothetical protein EV650_3214 [Kribbella kalugense]
MPCQCTFQQCLAPTQGRGVGALTQSASEDRVQHLAEKDFLEQKYDLLRSYLTAALRYG